MLKKSVDIVNRNLLPIVLLAAFIFLNSLFYALNPRPAVLFKLLTMVIYLVLVCGMLSSLWQYSREGRYDFAKGIKDNFLRYLGANILLGMAIVVPMGFVLIVSKGSLSSREFIQTPTIQLLTFMYLILARPLFVFVNSYVFTKGKGLDAVLDGLLYIKKHYKNTSAIGIALFYSVVASLSNTLGSIAWFPMAKITLSLIMSFSIAYLMGLAFVAVSFTINKE